MMRNVVAMTASVLALALAGLAVAQDDPQRDTTTDDVFADPTEPGEPDPAATADAPSSTPTDAQATPAAGAQSLTPAPGSDDVPGPASALEGLGGDPATPEAETAAPTPTSSGRRGEVVTLRALDKITARYTDLQIPIGQKKRFASLEILPRSCDKRPPEEFPETTAFVEIFDRDTGDARTSSDVALDAKTATKPTPAAAAAAKSARIFSGWMFASSPGLSALDHPVYDVWVIDCKTASASK